MATTFKWTAPETLAAYLSTDLNSLANSTSDTTGFSASGAEIDNTTDLFQYLALELVLAAQGAARAAGASIEIWIEVAVDPTPTYEDRANAAFTNRLLAVIGLDAATTARRRNVEHIVIPPLKFKLYVRNRTGQAFAASGNTLKYRRYNEQGV